MITAFFYFCAIAVIAYLAYNPHEYAHLNINEINEKNINFLYVFSSNMWLIIKNYGLGLITFGVYPIFSVIQNILAIGLIGNGLLINDEVALFYKMVPHGLLEIFGLVLSSVAIMYCIYKIFSSIPSIIKREKK